MKGSPTNMPKHKPVTYRPLFSGFNETFERLMMRRVADEGGHMAWTDLATWMKRCPKRDPRSVDHTYICSQKLIICPLHGVSCVALSPETLAELC